MNKEKAGIEMGLDSYVVENVVRHMSQDDWNEFLVTRRYGMSFIKELQRFLNEKYVNSEHRMRREHYGQLCNKAVYPGYYPPYECNISAKQYHMTEDGEIPTRRRTPTTVYERDFGGSKFPVYMTEDEYKYRFFQPHRYCIEDYTQPSGYYTYTIHPRYPAQYVLCRRNNNGNTEGIRNMP